jgi:hypothetical protein
MTIRRTFSSLVLVVFALLVFATGCGSSHKGPTPVGNFSISSLSGAYAFVFSGNDANGPFAVAGTLVADGGGTINSGALDVNQRPNPAPNTGLTGTYTIAADGRGTATLNSAAGNFTIDFALVSTSRALITRFETAANGSGTMDKMNSSAFSAAALAGTLVFNLHGVDSAKNPLATVGSITTDASGTVTSGVQDVSDNGSVLTSQPITGGSLQVTNNGRGTAAITTSSGPLNFAFYVVDANHIKLIETDNLPAISGEAFRQNGPISNASFTGPFAFTTAGADVAHGSSAFGAVLTSDGAGNITSGSADFNNGGAVTTKIAVTGTYALDASGRGTATLTSASAGTFHFVIYPTLNEVEMLNVDSGLAMTGAAFAQTVPFTNAVLHGTYALTEAQSTSFGLVTANAAESFDGIGRLNGLTDINDLGSLSTATPMTGAYVFDSTGHGTITLQSGIGQQNLAAYAVDGTRVLFLGTDNGSLTVGHIEAN